MVDRVGNDSDMSDNILRDGNVYEIRIKQMKANHTAYLAFGTNIGDREANIERAYQMVEERAGHILRRSSLMKSEPWGFESDNLFLNSVACILTTLTPHQLLAVTQKIEKDMGRREKSKDGVYHDRLIDIDILLYDDITLKSPELTIPHPLMTKRDFVMIPLKEIKP